MVDMARAPQEIQESMEAYQPPAYPYGLCICLTHEELDKLGLDSDCEVGDILHMVSMARVTSVNKSETSEGPSCRIELQLIDIEVLENESTEYSEDEELPRRRMSPEKFYRS